MAVPVDSADDVGRQRSAGILAQILALGTDFGELLGDRVGDGRIDRARQVDERVVAGEFLQHGGGVGFVVEPQRDFGGDRRAAAAGGPAPQAFSPWPLRAACGS